MNCPKILPGGVCGGLDFVWFSRFPPDFLQVLFGHALITDQVGDKFFGGAAEHPVDEVVNRIMSSCFPLETRIVPMGPALPLVTNDSLLFEVPKDRKDRRISQWSRQPGLYFRHCPGPGVP